VALGRGRLDEARRWLDESLDTGRRIGEIQFILTPLWALAELDLLSGDADRAVARVEDGWARAEATAERALFVPFVVTGVRAYLAAHRPSDAERWLTRAAGHLTGWDRIARPALAHGHGLVRLAAGSQSAAREALDAAVRGWDALDRCWEASWARLDLAQCLMRSNRHAEAVAVLDEARSAARRLGSEPVLARIAEVERAGRGRGLEDEPWRPLTVREFEVARLIAEGLTNGEIAERLDIAPKTASSHVEHILAKLGVTRRAEIAAWSATVRQPEARLDSPQPRAGESSMVISRG
jgi:DNA-binding CsgD family transcriptional regulator